MGKKEMEERNASTKFKVISNRKYFSIIVFNCIQNVSSPNQSYMKNTCAISDQLQTYFFFGDHRYLCIPIPIILHYFSLFLWRVFLLIALVFFLILHFYLFITLIANFNFRYPQGSIGLAWQQKIISFEMLRYEIQVRITIAILLNWYAMIRSDSSFREWECCLQLWHNPLYTVLQLSMFKREIYYKLLLL